MFEFAPLLNDLESNLMYGMTPKAQRRGTTAYDKFSPQIKVHLARPKEGGSKYQG